VSVYVFLGPTLPVEEARKILPATYLPPVAMGDVQALMSRTPRVIAIVDGLFEQTPAVWHKEILYALSRGVRVFGSSSMGALRAAELQAFGMEGVGRIFEAYVRGEYEDDDEVAVVHAPAESSYRVLSEAMVNIRLGLRLAGERGLVSAGTRRTLVDSAKRLFYPLRSWPAVVAEGRRQGVPEGELLALSEFVRQEAPDQKRADAVELLHRLGEECRAGARPRPSAFEFQPTAFWMHLTATRWRLPGADGKEDASGLPGERMRNHLRATTADREQILRGALLLWLSRAEARRAGIAAPALSTALERFRRRRGLLGAESLARWMSENGLTREDCAELAELEALGDELVAHYSAELDQLLPRELQRQGRFGQVAEMVDRKWRHLASVGLTNPTLADAGVEAEDLLRWYRARYGPVNGDLDGHARELGFASKRELVTEILAQYIFERDAGRRVQPRSEGAEAVRRGPVAG
jgi:hypothetical protein